MRFVFTKLFYLLAAAGVHRTGLRLISVALFAVLLSTTQGMASAQENTNGPPKAEAQKLTEAQTRYYEAQAAKLEQDRSLSQRIINLSAFLAALVAVLSLVLNYSSTLRTQRDSQFLEALKRFGDKDSPTVRSSAAGLLAKLSNQKGILFRSHRPNFDIGLEQLMSGLLLEENSVCLTSIRDALRHLAAYDPVRVLKGLYPSNWRIQRDTVRVLARFLAATTTTETGGPLDNETAISFGQHWHNAAALTSYEGFVLYTLADRHRDDFLRYYESAVQEFLTADPNQKGETVAEAQRALEVVGDRLKLNVSLYSELLGNDGFHPLLERLKPLKNAAKSSTDIAFTMMNVFLAKADLRRAKLHKIDFARAQLQQADLHSADLSEAYLGNAYLQGADLNAAQLQKANLGFAHLEPLKLKSHGAMFLEMIEATSGVFSPSDFTPEKVTQLNNAKLQGAKLQHANLQSVLGDGADFTNANWWQADFPKAEQVAGRYGKDSDRRLLIDLVKRYGSKFPEGENIHPSVISFLYQTSPEETTTQTEH